MSIQLENQIYTSNSKMALIWLVQWMSLDERDGSKDSGLGKDLRREAEQWLKQRLRGETKTEAKE